MKKLIVFDLDGTLVDTSVGLNECMNAALLKNGLRSISVEQTKTFVGDGIFNYAKRAVLACLNDSNEQNAHNLIKDVYDDFKRIYPKQGITGSTLYDGMANVLMNLKARGCILAALTNKAQRATDEFFNTVLKNFDFDAVIGQTDDRPLKPDPWGINALIERFNVNPENTVMIGDGETDYQTAKNAEVDHIAVLWGFRTKDKLKLCGATLFASRPEQLLSLINNL